MAQPGDVVSLSGSEKLEFVEVGRELLEVRATYDAGGKPPPMHHHPSQEERFTALSGTVSVKLGDEERTLSPEDGELVVPAGVDHSFWNPGVEPAVVKWQVRPALRTAQMWEELGEAGSKVAALAVLRRYKEEFRFASRILRAL